MHTPTVTVEPIEGYPALKLTWQHLVREADVAPAFRKIRHALDRATQPLYVVVDVTRDPRFPLKVTVQEALEAYRDPMLKEWLVVGTSWMAKAIENTLSRITRHNNVRWFNSEADALAYLSSVLAA